MIPLLDEKAGGMIDCEGQRLPIAYVVDSGFVT